MLRRPLRNHHCRLINNRKCHTMSNTCLRQQPNMKNCESRARSNSDMEIPETSKHKENITTQRKHKEHTTSLNCIENIHGTKKHQNTNANSKKTQPNAHIPSHKISRASRQSGSRSVGLQASRASDQSGFRSVRHIHEAHEDLVAHEGLAAHEDLAAHDKGGSCRLFSLRAPDLWGAVVLVGLGLIVVRDSWLLCE